MVHIRSEGTVLSRIKDVTIKGSHPEKGCQGLSTTVPVGGCSLIPIRKRFLCEPQSGFAFAECKKECESESRRGEESLHFNRRAYFWNSSLFLPQVFECDDDVFTTRWDGRRRQTHSHIFLSTLPYIIAIQILH
jgi:hypothetical protein